jgi:hypothetical protein
MARKRVRLPKADVGRDLKRIMDAKRESEKSERHASFQNALSALDLSDLMLRYAWELFKSGEEPEKILARIQQPAPVRGLPPIRSEPITVTRLPAQPKSAPETEPEPGPSTVAVTSVRELPPLRGHNRTTPTLESRIEPQTRAFPVSAFDPKTEPEPESVEEDAEPQEVDGPRDFAAIVRARIAAEGWSGYSLGIATGVHFSIIRRFMAGQRDIRLETFNKICTTLGLGLFPVPDDERDD